MFMPVVMEWIPFCHEGETDANQLVAGVKLQPVSPGRCFFRSIRSNPLDNYQILHITFLMTFCPCAAARPSYSSRKAFLCRRHGAVINCISMSVTLLGPSRWQHIRAVKAAKLLLIGQIETVQFKTACFDLRVAP